MDRAQMYHNMTTAELKDKFTSLKNELFNLRFQHASGQIKQPKMLETVKKDIARVLTVLREREIGVVKNEGKQTKKPVAKAKATKKTEGGDK